MPWTLLLTGNDRVQVLAAAMLAPVKLNAAAPAIKVVGEKLPQPDPVTVPPEATKPLGKVSVKLTPVKA